MIQWPCPVMDIMSIPHNISADSIKITRTGGGVPGPNEEVINLR